MKIILTLLLITSCFISSADESLYKTYTNERYGVSFEYPKWAEIEDVSQNGKIKIWFKVGGKSVTGVLFSVASEKSFKDFIESEKKNQIQGKYKKEITEKQFNIENSEFALEFIRENKPANNKTYYFVFPSLKEKAVLSLWHLQDTTIGFMGNSEEEAKAVGEYNHMIQTLNIKNK